jgi:hypothetical protein
MGCVMENVGAGEMIYSRVKAILVGASRVISSGTRTNGVHVNGGLC